MKKLAAIAMAIFMMAAVVSGCGGDNSETNATKESTEKITNSVKVPTKETKETKENETKESETDSETTEETTDATEAEETTDSEETETAAPANNEVEETEAPSTTQAPAEETDPPYVAPEPTQAPTSASEPEPTDPPVQSGTFTSSDAYFSYNGVTISIGADINNIIASIGSPSSTSEADSCFGEGKDIAHYYGSFTINTVPSNGVNVVNTITVNSTPKGVSVGQSESAIVAAYGSSGKVNDYLYSFTNGGTLNFYLSGGTITAIEYC